MIGNMNPAILADLIQINNDLRIFCNGCGRCRDLDVHTLAKTLGPQMAVARDHGVSRMIVMRIRDAVGQLYRFAMA
jgi:hypothetical protein